VRILLWSFIAIFSGIAQDLHAQAFPSKPVSIVVAFPAGGGLDVTARAFGKKLSEYWRQPVVIVNRPGASGMIGAEAVVRSPNDGYTLLFASPAEIAINPSLYPKIGYDPITELAPISLAATTPGVITVGASVPVKGMAELKAVAGKTDGGLPYGTAGIGSLQQLIGEWLKANEGFNLRHIPYKGTAPMLQDLLGHQIPAAISGPAALVPYIRQGTVRPLAVTSAQRSPSLPDVPTLRELGIDFESTIWFALFAPAGTPPDVIAKINADIKRAVADPELVRALSPQALDPVASGTPQEFATFVKGEAAKYSRIIRDAHIVVE
jgi:tripartite-type tricarboxylate transporter receptor subunit TctC